MAFVKVTNHRNRTQSSQCKNSKGHNQRTFSCNVCKAKFMQHQQRQIIINS